MIRTHQRHLMTRAAIVRRMRDHDREAGLLEMMAINATEEAARLEARARIERALADELGLILSGHENGTKRKRGI
jgi:hypothetical protein